MLFLPQISHIRNFLTGVPSCLGFSCSRYNRPRLGITVMQLVFLKRSRVSCDWITERSFCSSTKEQNSAAPGRDRHRWDIWEMLLISSLKANRIGVLCVTCHQKHSSASRPELPAHVASHTCCPVHFVCNYQKLYVPLEEFHCTLRATVSSAAPRKVFHSSIQSD